MILRLEAMTSNQAQKKNKRKQKRKGARKTNADVPDSGKEHKRAASVPVRVPCLFTLSQYTSVSLSFHRFCRIHNYNNHNNNK